MGNPMNGDIYEGMLRPGDVELEKSEFDFLKQIDAKERIADLQRRFMERPAQATGDGGVSREMPRYKCHKEVWALKIAEIKPHDPPAGEIERAAATFSNLKTASDVAVRSAIRGATITPADDGFAPFWVDSAFMEKHNPKVGGYYVVYKDGYKSYSPAQAFEEGYTRL